MNHHKLVTLSVTIMAALTLSACTSHTKGNTSSKSAIVSSKSVKSKSQKATAKTATSTKKAGIMNLAQIQKGDYSSLAGTWTEVRTGANRHDATGIDYTDGGTDPITMTKNKIVNGQMSIQGQTLTDADGRKNLIFQTKDHVLTASLADPSVAINWSVSFYPKGTTDANKEEIGAVGNDRNLIVIWTSNNSYTQVFAQGPAKAVATTTQTSLNISQIAQNNFASLVGTWKNETDGKTIVVTNQTMNKPAGSHVDASIGAVVSGADNNGYPEVITSGTITVGYIQGGIGTFDPSIMGSAFEPFLIVPKNVKLPAAQGLYDTDDSDTTRDQLVRGIQSGNGVQPHTYYRQ